MVIAGDVLSLLLDWLRGDVYDKVPTVGRSYLLNVVGDLHILVIASLILS